MENGVEIVDGSHEVEKRTLEVSEGRGEEAVVFEDALNSEEQLLEQRLTSGSDDGEKGKVETVGDSGFEGVREGNNSDHEVEEFEEANDVPTQSLTGGSEEKDGEEKEPAAIFIKQEEDLLGGRSDGESAVAVGIDEGETEKEVAADLNGLTENGPLREDWGEDVTEVGSNREDEVLKGEDQVDDNSGVVSMKPEGEDSINVNLEPLKVADNLETKDINVVEEDNIYSHPDTESNGGNLDESGNDQDLEENDLNMDLREEETRETTNAQTVHHIELPDHTSTELSDSFANVNTAFRDEKRAEIKVSTADTVSRNGDDKGEDLCKYEHLDHRNLEDNDTSRGLELERCGETFDLKDTLTGVSNSVEERAVEMENGHSTPSAEINNEKTEEIQGTETGMIEKDSVEGRAVEMESGHSIPSANVNNEKMEEIQNTESDEIEEDYHNTQHQHVGANGITGIEKLEEREKEVEEEKLSTQAVKDTEIQAAPDLANGINGTGAEKLEERVKEVQEVNLSTQAMKNTEIQAAPDLTNCINGTGAGKLEEIEKRVQEESLSTQAIKDTEIQKASDLASSHGKSTNPAPPPGRPAGLGRAAPLLEPAPRMVQQPRVNGTFSPMQAQQIEDPANGEVEENDETREKLQMIRVKFLRLAHRLGQTPHNVVVAQVLYRLGLAEQLRGRNGGRVGAFSFDRASAMAEQLEAAGQEPLDFSCTIMVLGKTGVGKSATINSIFDEVKFSTDAFQMGTKKVQDVVGTVQGIKVRVIDTPGLLSSWSDQQQNEKILLSVKRFIKKTPPDIVLYLDRLDVQNRDFGDMPLLRTITEIFGPSIWFNAIVVLTHAASAPPDGPNGIASSYDMFVTQRSHVVQQAIRQAAGDMRLMNPVSLVENHSACRTNRAGQRVLPNGQVWKPHLLLLSFASKILAEANTLLKLQDSPPGKPFAARTRAPPLPFLLSSLLQSRPQVKLPEDQLVDGDGLEDDLDESSDSEDESEYDELPPFKRLTKAQVAKLSKAQKKAYFDELEYREKLFMKKQLKEEKRRRKLMKKMAAEVKDLPSDYGENVEEESGNAASVPVPMPDLALPASFDSDYPTHRYRYLDSSNQWLIRPVLETHGWDHDVGYEGINAEKLFVIKDKIPISFSGQVTKDKKDSNVQMEMTSSIKHGEGKATSFGFDMQTIGKDLAYTLRTETIFCNFRKNKAVAGLSATLLGDALSAGVKVEDSLVASKRFRLVMTGGVMTGRGDVAYGGSLEAQLRDKDYPLGRSLSTLGLTIMDWHGDLAIGCNIQSQIPIGRSTNLIGRANLNNRGAGQLSIRLNSSEQLQIALIGLVPLVKKVLGLSQQLQFGQ